MVIFPSIIDAQGQSITILLPFTATARVLMTYPMVLLHNTNTICHIGHLHNDYWVYNSYSPSILALKHVLHFTTPHT